MTQPRAYSFVKCSRCNIRPKVYADWWDIAEMWTVTIRCPKCLRNECAWADVINKAALLEASGYWMSENKPDTHPTP